VGSGGRILVRFPAEFTLRGSPPLRGSYRGTKKNLKEKILPKGSA
jgi:hypothetical protein